MIRRGGPVRLSVVIPTFRRPESLARCLEGMARQTRPLDEILVVARTDDAPTHDVLRSAPAPVRAVEVTEPGLLAAMQAGVCAAAGDVIAFTDDDAIARRDWAQGLEDHFADSSVGAVGGRDLIATETDGETTDVGRITRWGKLVGNQHLAVGPARSVDVLKGANMAFRRPALALPKDLRGRGTQIHSEIPMCAWARSHGWRVVFDPMLVVDHLPAPRPAGDKRARRASDVRDASFNLVFGIVSSYPELALRRATYGLLAGDRLTPGLVRTAVAAARRERDVVRIAPAALLGQTAALLAVARGRRQRMVPVGEAPQLRPGGARARA